MQEILHRHEWSLLTIFSTYWRHIELPYVRRAVMLCRPHKFLSILQANINNCRGPAANSSCKQSPSIRSSLRTNVKSSIPRQTIRLSTSCQSGTMDYGVHGEVTIRYNVPTSAEVYLKSRNIAKMRTDGPTSSDREAMVEGRKRARQTSYGTAIRLASNFSEQLDGKNCLRLGELPNEHPKLNSPAERALTHFSATNRIML